MSSETTGRDIKPAVDATDLRILAILQADAAVPIAEIAHRVGLSQTPCWRRIQRLERDGIIRARIAVINPLAVGLKQVVMVFVQMIDHTPERLNEFARVLADMPEVIEAHRLAGVHDYILHVIAEDNVAYEQFYTKLIARVPLKSVTSHIALECVKERAPFPLTPPSL
jgi:Lrp/AsnC family transcriptional regulator